MMATVVAPRTYTMAPVTRRARAARLMILREIARREAADERPPTLDDLAALTGLDRTTVHFHVRRMESVGWLDSGHGGRRGGSFPILTEDGRRQLD